MELFDNDETGYLNWIKVHSTGWVANADKAKAIPNYPLVHRASHASLSSPTKTNYTTGLYIKACSDDVAELEAWSLAEYGKPVTWCETCAPNGAKGAKVDKSAGGRNPPWSRDELILALALYMTNPASPPGKSSDAVVELSSFLGKLAVAAGFATEAAFRNPNGVYMKMMNFRRFDPEFTADGKTGLTRGNKDEEVVWRLFANEPARLQAVATAIRAGVASGEAAQSWAGDIEEADEGRVVTRMHRVRERDQRLVDACKAKAFKTHGRLFCQACGFDFGTVYGKSTGHLIDCHHTKPVHTLTADSKTHVDDLVLLCANCHRVVHARKRWLTISELKELLGVNRATDTACAAPTVAET